VIPTASFPAVVYDSIIIIIVEWIRCVLHLDLNIFFSARHTRRRNPIRATIGRFNYIIPAFGSESSKEYVAVMIPSHIVVNFSRRISN
jgi:hypothetical protein